MSDDLVATLSDIAEQAKKSVAAAISVGDPHQLSHSIGRWGELFGQAAEEITRLRKENELLGGALVEISGHADLGGPWCAAKARSALEGLGCQANAMQGGEAVSQAEPALHLGAGGEAHWNPMSTAPKPKVKHWGDAPLILAATKFEYHDPVLVRWLHHDQIWLASMGAGFRDEDLIGWLPLPQTRRQDEERASAMSANREHIASLTPIKTHENPPRTAEDQSTAIAQPPEASSHQKPT